MLIGRSRVPGGAAQEIDPVSLPLPADLMDALNEWAHVVQAVQRPGGTPETSTGELVSRRGRQLASRLAAVTGRPVSYSDPMRGVVELIEVPAARAPTPGEHRPEVKGVVEPTPWGSGLTVTTITAVLVVCAMVILSLTLSEAGPWPAVAANVLVAGGLAPSVWLARSVPVWRWVAFGVVVGMFAAWLALLLTLLG